MVHQVHLREILTVKSDDVIGRAKTYEAIVKGEPMPEPGLPESFNVLMHELKGLGLDIRLENKSVSKDEYHLYAPFKKFTKYSITIYYGKKTR